MTAWFGNALIWVRGFTYLLRMGKDGLKLASQLAVLNANYIRAKLKDHYDIPYPDACMHECVFSDHGFPGEVTTMEIAKRLIDYGFHPPTIYFPLVVHEALMIEPTETETKETLDRFAETMIRIAEEARTEPEKLRKAPTTTPVRRLDEVKAAKEPVVRWKA